MKYIFLLFVSIGFLFGQSSGKKIVLIEWEPVPEAKAYYLQISDSKKFLKVTFQKEMKETRIELEPNPNYRYGRIAGIDHYGVKGEYSEIFEIEYRIIEAKNESIEKKNYLSANDKVFLGNSEGENNSKKLFYKINDSSWEEYAKPFALKTEGSNKIAYTDSETRENSRIFQKELFLDTQAPEVQIKTEFAYLDPNETIHLSKSSKIITNITDTGSGIREVETSFVTEKFTIPVSLSPNGEVIFNEKLNQSKEFLLYFKVTDNVGNTRELMKYFQYDSTPPEIQITPQIGEQKFLQPGAIFIIKASDDSSGLKSLKYSVNDGVFEEYRKEIQLTMPGEYEIQVMATDNAGNISRITTGKFYIIQTDSKVPRLQILRK